MTALYPLKFRTIFKETLWGGEKIRSYLNKDFSPLRNCGEAWELSGAGPDVSIVDNGPLAGQSLPALIERYRAALLGHAVHERFGTQLPLLVKFIDANDDLSIQAHPNDELARERHNCLGKTEMWYVVQADAGATLVAGFNRHLSRQAYLETLASGSLAGILNRETVQAGDVFFLPAGRIHAIGRGILVAEIQQSSNITYRIHDFDRVDAAGKPRELHTEQALAALDYTFCASAKVPYRRQLNEPVKVVECDYFTTNVLESTRSMWRDYAFDSFVILLCVDGSCSLNYRDVVVPMALGDCVLVPAAVHTLLLETEHGFTLLESYVAVR